MSIYTTVRPLLFKIPPETSHNLGKGVLKLSQSNPLSRRMIRSVYQYDHPLLEVERFGISFPNPVGVSAGFDKNGEVFHALADLGFGFVEVGTVTPRPQVGNPRPRLFRIPEERGLIGRMGFAGDGADRIYERFENRGVPDIPVAVSIGKMNDSTEDEAVDDLRYVFRKFNDYPAYFVVNVSCPNTPETYDQEEPDYLSRVLTMLQDENTTGKPILVKVSPDSTSDQLGNLVSVVEEYDISGILATNGTKSRESTSSPLKDEPGGLNGAPLFERSTKVLRTLHQLTDLPLIGIGGVSSAETAYQKIRSGASLVQLLTGFVYEGPSTARSINMGLVEKLEADGFTSIDDAVGIDVE